MDDIIPYWTWAASLLALAVAYGAALATQELRTLRAAHHDVKPEDAQGFPTSRTRNT
jgi:hypothetical protein